ncbi:MAG: hypothetical protein FJX57_05730 [Alphaproteobacteria bacterium]|nr:hypothetical protein [Alphaproteobacteria bacterium]
MTKKNDHTTIDYTKITRDIAEIFRDDPELREIEALQARRTDEFQTAGAEAAQLRGQLAEASTTPAADRAGTSAEIALIDDVPLAAAVPPPVAELRARLAAAQERERAGRQIVAKLDRRIAARRNIITENTINPALADLNRALAHAEAKALLALAQALSARHRLALAVDHAGSALQPIPFTSINALITLPSEADRALAVKLREGVALGLLDKAAVEAITGHTIPPPPPPRPAPERRVEDPENYQRHSRPMRTLGSLVAPLTQWTR